jgi:hypothetical protein
MNVSLPILPTGKPVPLFFGRRFLTARELLATGLVRNMVTLRRLIVEGRFPPPLLVGRKLRVWDTLELQNLIDRLAFERHQQREQQHDASEKGEPRHRCDGARGSDS